MAEITAVPSPFCGLGTDDLTVDVDGLTIKVTENGCAVNTPAFEQAIGATDARVQGKTASLEQAVSAAAVILRDTRQPVIGGCATDVNGMRALLAVAERTGAVVDNQSFTAARRNFLALQDAGWVNTTLAEIKNRCDLFVVFGVDLDTFAPRFFERYLWNSEAMYIDDTKAREIVYLGTAPSVPTTGSNVEVLTCADLDLPNVAAVLSALIKGQPIMAESVGGIAVADLNKLVEKLLAAKYSVITWSAAALAFNQAELTVQAVCNLVKEVNNRDTRCSGFPLGGKEGDQTANQVCGWITGYPARVNFNRGYAEYDPFLFDSQAMLDAGEADALLWVQAFNSASFPAKTDVPTIVIGRSGMAFEDEPDVFIPVGTPGIDHAGHAFRLDNVVAIRLKQLRNSTLPSTAEVLYAIEQAL